MRLWWLPFLLACNNRCQREPEDCETADIRVFFDDADGDGHGDPLEEIEACELPNGASTLGDDCDDADESLWTRASLWVDSDGDGFGIGSPVEVCDGLPGYADEDGDCDDEDASAWPGAPQVCRDGVDQDCDGASDCDLPTGADTVEEAATTHFYGEAGGALGTAVAGLGDLDGDGLADLGLGAPLADPWGGAVVYYGPTDVIEDLGTADVTLVSVETDADATAIQIGAALGASDLTGDGIRDLLVAAGTGHRDYGGGSINIVPGPIPTSVVVNDGVSALTIVAAGGDLILTGMDYAGSDDLDLIMGSGALDLFLGPIDEGGEGEDLEKGELGSTGDDNGTFGVSAALGDLDGDGALDLISGAPRVEHLSADEEDYGEFGGFFRFSSSSDFRMDTSSFYCCEDLAVYGTTEGGELGAAVAFAGDPDGDGYDDLYVGAPGALNDDGEATGAVLYFDGAGLAAFEAEAEAFSDIATFTIFGGEPGDEFGASLLTGLAVDGQAALVVGAPGRDDEAGAVALWYGQPAAGDTIYEADYRLSGTASGDRFGATLANAGDTNGLGWDDLLIGAPGTSGGDGAGWLLVFDLY